MDRHRVLDGAAMRAGIPTDQKASRLLIATAVLVVLFSGCGDGDNETLQPTPTANGVTPTATASTATATPTTPPTLTPNPSATPTAKATPVDATRFSGVYDLTSTTNGLVGINIGTWTATR